ncbi:hypothetical protein CIPAW_03G050000 [Carya illinoinensis]|uniref:Uncharacterized protein n=1 Tax=Carya illinoinensis TaxID=32201 RepID=A0A8T1QWZ9_CARIL|nr:hypothetical protein CIPAW_03G050000 [Carya illinoinensis]
MATRMLGLLFASFCMILAMLVAVGMSDSSWDYVHSPTSSRPPNTDAGPGGSAASCLSPHLLTTALLASLAFLLPFCLSFLC